MTCVVAVTLGGEVTMGCDSAGVGGYSLTVRKDRKIFQVGDFLIGFTSSFRMGQLLGYQFQPPKHHPDVSIEQYMHTDWIEAVRTCLKRYGYATTENNRDEGGVFLAAYRGRIFRIDQDFQIGESVLPYEAVGCGQDIALGAFFAMHDSPAALTGRMQCMQALAAAEQFSAGVRAPFHVETITRGEP